MSPYFSPGSYRAQRGCFISSIDVVFDLGLSLLNSRSDVLTHVLKTCILVRTCSSIQSINGKSILNFRLLLFRSFVNFLCFLRCWHGRSYLRLNEIGLQKKIEIYGNSVELRDVICMTVLPALLSFIVWYFHCSYCAVDEARLAWRLNFSRTSIALSFDLRIFNQEI